MSLKPSFFTEGVLPRDKRRPTLSKMKLFLCFQICHAAMVKNSMKKGFWDWVLTCCIISKNSLVKSQLIFTFHGWRLFAIVYVTLWVDVLVIQVTYVDLIWNLNWHEIMKISLLKPSVLWWYFKFASPLAVWEPKLRLVSFLRTSLKKHCSQATV